MKLLKFELAEGPIWINPRTVVAVRPTDPENSTGTTIFLMGLAGQIQTDLTPTEVVELLAAEGAPRSVGRIGPDDQVFDSIS